MLEGIHRRDEQSYYRQSGGIDIHDNGIELCGNGGWHRDGISLSGKLLAFGVGGLVYLHVVGVPDYARSKVWKYSVLYLLLMVV